MVKIKNNQFLNIRTKTIHVDGLSRRLPLGGFKWIDETFQLNEDFIKSCDDDSDEGYFL